ncbi:alpha/beta hydrolase family protein [Jidongwangia harbinensis]|uniref:alpha/beta hydrolase family protein n=1 Tax=Jidongwangia harbinensis TaxID=2878561 RepID=UPI001CDA2487|nr:chlorophyllase [Jidongwangia harbinensis]MCA2213436.1 chlorophyllase [Jidongwangia harbinensis]
MRRRTAALAIVALSVAGLLNACSADQPPAADSPTAGPRSPAPSPAPAPPSAGGAPKGLPAAGTAPTTRFQVEVRTLRFHRGPDRPLTTTVWYPADGDGPFPLVVFSHGLTSEPAAYASVLRSWARAGFVVAAPAFPHTSYRARDFDALDVINQPADASEVITRMLALNETDGDLRGRIAPARIGAAGHSAGGITTIGMFSGARDPRLIAGIVLSGRRVLPAPFTGPAAPLLFVHGKRDKTVRYADGLAAYRAVPWPRAMMAVTEGGHVAITKDFGPVITTTTDFWRWSLYGDGTAKDRLKADATRGGRATFTDDL